MNEYFIKLSVAHYQHLPSTELLFINADSGKEAWEKAYKQTKEEWEFYKDTSNEVVGITLIDIHKL